jgi:hypothetical protein
LAIRVFTQCWTFIATSWHARSYDSACKPRTHGPHMVSLQSDSA